MIRALGLLCVAVLVAGCGGGEDDAMTVDWDLSRSHRVADVDWPRPELTATSFAPEGEVRIRLPEDVEVRAPAGEVHDVTMSREGDAVRVINLDSQRLSADDARALARRRADELDLQGQVRDGLDDTILNARAPLGGADGPFLSVEIRDAGTPEETPYIVTVQALWDAPGAGAATAP